MPKASALKSHQSNGSRLDKTLLALRKHSRVLRHRRAFADCFGANPVASALGNLARRDPNEAVRIYHEGQQPILKTGTFYLAGKRNFLFGSDTGVLSDVEPEVRQQVEKLLAQDSGGQILDQPAAELLDESTQTVLAP